MEVDDLRLTSSASALTFKFVCRSGSSRLRITLRAKKNIVNKWPNTLATLTSILWKLTGEDGHDIELGEIVIEEEK